MWVFKGIFFSFWSNIWKNLLCKNIYPRNGTNQLLTVIGTALLAACPAFTLCCKFYSGTCNVKFLRLFLSYFSQVKLIPKSKLLPFELCHRNKRCVSISKLVKCREYVQSHFLISNVTAANVRYA